MLGSNNHRSLRNKALGLIATGAVLLAPVGVAQAEVSLGVTAFRTAFDHIAFDTFVRPMGTDSPDPPYNIVGVDLTPGQPPLPSPGFPLPSIGPTSTFEDKEDSAYYSLRGLQIDPTGTYMYSSWLHGFGSRWIVRHELTDLQGTTSVGATSDFRDVTARFGAANDQPHARFDSRFEDTQSQPKSVAIDSDGVVYSSVLQGAFVNSAPPAFNDIFIYPATLNGNGPVYFGTNSPSFGTVDVDGDFDNTPPKPQTLANVPNPEGLATFGDRDTGDEVLYATSRNEDDPRLLRYDITARPGSSSLGTVNPPVVDLGFGTNGSLAIPSPIGSFPGINYFPSLRGVTVAPDGTVYIADLGGQRIIRIADPDNTAVISQIHLNDGVGDVFADSVEPHHLTVASIDGEEILFVTNRTDMTVLYVDTDDFSEASFREFEPEVSAGVTLSDRFPLAYGLGSIVAVGSDLFITLEDAEEFHDLALPLANGPVTDIYDIGRDQIIQVTVGDLVLDPFVGGGGDANVAVTPEPSTLAVAGLLGLLTLPRRRRAN